MNSLIYCSELIPWRRFSRPLGIALAVFVATLGGACSSSDTGRIALVESLLFSSPATDYPRTLAEIDAYPYAQLGVKYGDARPGIAVLAEYVDGNHLWVASDRFTLLTSPAGRILNLQVNGRFWRTSAIEPDPMSEPGVEVGFERSYQRPLEVGRVASPNSPQQVMQMRCRLTASGRERIAIKGREFDTAVWNEQCSAKGQSVSITIWVDGRQRMRRLDGQLGLGAKRIRLDMLKVPG